MHVQKAVANRLAAMQHSEKRFLGVACAAFPLEHAKESGAIRYTSTGRCCECEKLRVQRFREKNKAKP